MAMDDDSGRRQAIVTALTAELERQHKDSAGPIDAEALADAVELALQPAAPASEGKHPDELNATNDD